MAEAYHHQVSKPIHVLLTLAEVPVQRAAAVRVECLVRSANDAFWHTGVAQIHVVYSAHQTHPARFAVAIDAAGCDNLPNETTALTH